MVIIITETIIMVATEIVMVMDTEIMDTIHICHIHITHTIHTIHQHIHTVLIILHTQTILPIHLTMGVATPIAIILSILADTDTEIIVMDMVMDTEIMDTIMADGTVESISVGNEKIKYKNKIAPSGRFCFCF
ncbi:hypothetical protein SDC9_21693 [bioreactor metagenome]|uniref:Uncharacterized protein n=1 Tax=bioreactor metagenome TaxID=1076179 RepID=A0A644UA47_9ZZZZ